MTDIELIEKKIQELEDIACEIENLGSQLLSEAELEYVQDADEIHMGLGYFEWEKALRADLKSTQRKALRDYQTFYSAGLHFVTEFLPEKENEFVSCYKIEGRGEDLGILDYLLLRRIQFTSEKIEIIHRFIDRFEIQRSILLSIPFIVKVKEMNLREIMSADFIEREIEEAESLFNKDHYRAAGALAGVALEQHLRTLCDMYQIDYAKKDTIEPLVQKLYKNDKIEISQMKNIQHLASIRDKCDHPSEISREEIKEPIERVKKLL